MSKETFKVLVSDRIAEEGINLMEEQGFQVDVKLDLSHEDLVEIISEYDGMIVRSGTEVRKDVIDAATKLKAVARAGAGYNNINVKECSKRKIAVMITPTGNTLAVIELTLGLMISHARFIPIANTALKQGRWEKSKLKGTELSGKTLGIVGLGRIGQGVATRAQAFNMDVVAFDKYIPKSVAEGINVVLYDDLNEMLKKVDYVSLHVPLTDSTRNLLGKDQFLLMKKTAVIINVARGPVVNEKELYDALLACEIGGACIDVYSEEPASKEDFPFMNLDNVVVTPHLGANTKEAQIKVGTLAADHIIKALENQDYQDAVNLPFKDHC